MAATYVVVTNRTTSNLVAIGDHGMPSITIPKSPATENIDIADLLGNEALCTTLSTWITDAHITVTRGGYTISAADMTAWKQGSDMNRSDYDTNDDGLIDAAVISGFVYKGSIATAAGFPLIAAVETGWVYLVTAAVIDNAGVTYTNTSGVFTAGDSIQWNGTSWTILAPQNALQFRGAIAAAASFPTLALVKTGHAYVCTAAVTDNDGTRTNTGKVFVLGDVIVWYSNTWYIAARGASTTAPLAVGTAAAGTSLEASNRDHVHAHGNQLGGTLHADVVAGSTAGFMTGTQATNLIRVNDHTMALKLAGVTMTVDESEVSAQLTGDVGKKFSPTHIVVTVISVTGTPATPATLNIGTSTGGTQISSALAMTGLILAGDTRMIPLSAGTFNLAGNATLYANVEANEAVATSLVCDVWVHGLLTTPT